MLTNSIQQSSSNPDSHLYSIQEHKQNAYISSSITIPILLIGGLFLATRSLLAETEQSIAWTPIAYTTGATIIAAGAGATCLTIVITVIALGALASLSCVLIKRTLTFSRPTT